MHNMRKRRNIYLDETQYEMLRRLAFRLTAAEEQHVSVAELVRRAIDSTYGSRLLSVAEEAARYDDPE